MMVSACNPLDTDTPRDVRVVTPEPDLRPGRTVSVMFAIDASISMSDEIDETRKGIDAAIEFLLAKYDLAGLVSFNEFVVVEAPLTDNFYTVSEAAKNITPHLQTRMWDGGYAAVEALINGPKRDVQAVILVTDGKDEGSSVLYEEFRDYAHQNQVVVYPIGLGKQALLDEETLQNLALVTEGHYYYFDTEDADAEPLAVVFRDIFTDHIRQKP